MQILVFTFFAFVTILSLSVLVAMLSSNASRIAAAMRGDVVSSQNRVTFVTFQYDRRARSIIRNAARPVLCDLPLAA